MINLFVIEKGIPLPEREEPSEKYNVIKDMEVGDSILVKNASQKQRVAARLGSGKYTTRSNEDGTIRIWRTK